MADPIQKTRQEFLLDVQNADGGWGYFPGKRSWLEPTLYAALALKGTPSAERAHALIRSWALPEGGWRSSADLPDPSWATSLVISLYSWNGWFDGALQSGVIRLLRTVGAEGSFIQQLHHEVHPEVNDIDYTLQGWPWRPGTTSWVEPTAYAVLALRSVLRSPLSGRFGLAARRRIDVAEKMLLERRTSDGDWNCGAHRVWSVDLPSYPETTGLALMALHGNPRLDLRNSLDVAASHAREAKSPLAMVWLTVALRLYGRTLPAAVSANSAPSQDILLAGMQSIAASGVADRFFAGPRKQA